MLGYTAHGVAHGHLRWRGHVLGELIDEDRDFVSPGLKLGNMHVDNNIDLAPRLPLTPDIVFTRVFQCITSLIGHRARFVLGRTEVSPLPGLA